MKELINTDRITLEHDPIDNEYRLSLYDKFYHYLSEVYLAPEQLRDLLENADKIHIKSEDDYL